MKLADLIKQSIQQNNEVQSNVSPGKGPEHILPRTFMSPSDAYDTDIGPKPPFDGFHPGANRAMWAVADQQQASVPVTAITSSGNTKSAFLAAIQGGIAQNPVAPATTWAAVPSLITNLSVKGPVVIVANASLKSSVASDTVGLAIYRDGQLIGNHVTHTLPLLTMSSMLQISAMDNPPPGNHVYAMYWSPGTGTLTAVSNQRNMYVINLSPQG